MTQVREVEKSVSLDGAKGGGGGFMSKLFSRGGSSAVTRPVVELVTPGRTYNLAPATIHMPAPMTTSAALANAAGSKPLYLFGWPFPVPAMDGGDDEAEVASGFLENKLPADAFTQWRDVLATAVAAEKATRTYPVTTLVDSTGQLPQRVFLRTTPCELAIVSMEDKDLCFAALPYNDLLKWDCPVEGEIHVTARTRARLVAKSDKQGFSTQRPTRATCHFVFKCGDAKGIATVIDNHLRALAKQLSGLGDGADDAEIAAASAGSVAAGEEDAAAAGGAGGAAGGAGASSKGDEDEDKKAASRLTAKKPAARKAEEEEEEAADEEDAPKKKAKGESQFFPHLCRHYHCDVVGLLELNQLMLCVDTRLLAAVSRWRRMNPLPLLIFLVLVAGKKKSLAEEEDEEEEEEAPKATRKSSKKKSLADEEDEEEEEEAPKKSTRKSSKKKSLADEEDDE